jgi:hypothetical protein
MNQSKEATALESLSSLYFNSALLGAGDVQVVAPHVLYRIEGKDGRLYAKYDEETGQISAYPSVTTLIRGAAPTSPYLIEWLRKTSKEESERIVYEASEHGALLHELIATLCTVGRLSVEQIRNVVSERVAAMRALRRVEATEDAWVRDLTRAMMAFGRWVADYEVRVIAVELALSSDADRVAGAMDLVCVMNDRLYTDKTPASKRRRVGAIVDAKRAHPGADDYVIQLALYRRLWERSPYGSSLKIGRLYNWTPKDWRKEPTYDLVDLTERADALPLDAWLTVAHSQVSSEPKDVLVFSGEMSMSGSDLITVEKMSSLQDLLRRI